jgi:hypothetical protein
MLSANRKALQPRRAYFSLSDLVSYYVRAHMRAAEKAYALYFELKFVMFCEMILKQTP